jgi:hypothetical protein
MQKLSHDLALKIAEKAINGEPVNDYMVKSAEISLNVPNLLLEARFFSNYNYIKTAQKLSQSELDYVAHACGSTIDEMDKIAYSRGVDTLELMRDMLVAYGPNFDKLAEFDSGQPTGQTLNQPNITNPAAMMGQDAVGNPTVNPGPQSIDQMPPMTQGNMGQLVSNYENRDEIAAQQEQSQAQALMEQTKAQVQPGSKEEMEALYTQLTPEQKVEHAIPGVTPEEAQRYGEEVKKVEEQAGTTIRDAQQIKKVVDSIKKQEKKVIDDIIKQQYSTQQTGFGGQPVQQGPVSPMEGIGQAQPQAQPMDPQQKIARILKLRF